MRLKRFIVAFFAAALLAAGVAGPASAQLQVQDGLVSVAIGDIEILKNANIGVAAEVAAQVCGVNVSDVAILAEQVDNSRNGQQTVCRTEQGPVVISQNLP